eukprot:3715926-Rhodomonas_salina.1
MSSAILLMRVRDEKNRRARLPNYRTWSFGDPVTPKAVGEEKAAVPAAADNKRRAEKRILLRSGLGVTPLVKDCCTIVPLGTLGTEGNAVRKFVLSEKCSTTCGFGSTKL